MKAPAPPRRLAAVVAAAVLLGGCGVASPRFPLAPPLWNDPDRNHVPRRPAEFYSGLYADAVEQTLLRPLAQLFALPLPGEARNVNAVDEVPNSSWFHNRIGLFELSPAEVARGSCDDPPLDPRRGPWIVTRAKTEGATPGFFIRAPDGHRYLLKFDTSFRPQRATAADVIGSKLYHAAGYHTPCNEVVYFRRRLLAIGPEATARGAGGREVPLTGRALERVLDRAFRLKDGRLRAAASRFVPGQPLGPAPLVGVRGDDPNDVIPHEDRRELRASRLLAAWINHFDVREQNSLDAWVRQGGRRFVRHYQMDFGDALGTPWTNLLKDVRAGRSHYLDLEHVLVDMVTLGAVPRPWHHAPRSRYFDTFGFFHWRGFVPSRWRAIYPNPAFERMTAADALWMVRIIVRFSDAHIRAVVRRGRMTSPGAERFLVRTLIRRRDRIAREYLTRHVPLARFRLVRRTRGRPAQSLCFEDLAIEHAGVDPELVRYKIRAFGGRQLRRRLGWLQFHPDPRHPRRSCVLLPVGDRRPADLLAGPGAPDDHPLRYAVVRIHVSQTLDGRATTAEVHVVDLGPRRGFRIVGIRRP